MNFVAGALASAVRMFDSSGAPRHVEQTPRQRAEERLARARAVSKALDELETAGEAVAVVFGVATALRG